MKRLLAILVAVVAGVMFLSTAVYAEGGKTAKGTVSVSKGSDGKIASVSITTDSGMHIQVAHADFAKYESMDKKYVQVSYTTDKEGKNIASGAPTVTAPEKKDGKIKDPPKKKM